MGAGQNQAAEYATQREHQRVTAAIPVRLRYSDPDEFISVYTRDISLGGVFIESSVEVPLGTVLDLTVDFGLNKGLRVMAQVVWFRAATQTSPAGMGARFVKMPEAHQQWLDSALKKIAETHEQEDRSDSTLRRALRPVDEFAQVSLSDFEVVDGAVLGIDLGTSNCCAAIAHDDGRVEFIDLSHPDLPAKDKVLMPSVVHFSETGKTEVGYAAAEQLTTRPERTIFGSKRFLGRPFNAHDVQTLKKRFPWEIVGSNNGKAAAKLPERAVALTSVASKLLTEIAQKASQQLNATIRRTVITVPAYFGDQQRQAVVQAGRLAGLMVERIINEPTAAAITYGAQSAQEKLFLVYDLGGGTFDISVMQSSAKQLRVLATAGDNFLGGEDFDTVITRFCIDYAAQTLKTPLGRSPQNMARIKHACREAKERLSSADETRIVLREAQFEGGKLGRLEVPLQREKLEQLVEPLVERTVKIAESALRQAELKSENVAEILMVGGQTRMPYLQQTLSRRLGVKVRNDVNPDQAVAQGAAQLIRLGTGGVDFLDVVSIPIGVAIGRSFKELVGANTQIPSRHSFPLSVPRDKFEDYTIEVYQGTSKWVDENEHLGTLPANSVNPGSKDTIRLKVEFLLTENGLLKVRLTNKETDESQFVLLHTTGPAD